MVDINVNKNQGLISAIKTKLNAEQIDTSKCNASIWSQVLEQVTIENEQNKMGMLLLIAMTIMAWLIRKVRRTITDKEQN
jgi:hypothetical protein